MVVLSCILSYEGGIDRRINVQDFLGKDLKKDFSKKD
jgi:hypothetical protein